VVLDPADPWIMTGSALARAALTAASLVLVRWCYGKLRNREGLGWGDVKLGAAIGAWLPVEFIPLCVCLASVGALTVVASAISLGHSLDRFSKIPFGAFLCPALWLTFFANVLLC